MQHLKDRTVREKTYRAFVARASAGERDNGPLIEQILKLRSELAGMLKYSNYAELSLSSKMAPSVEAVLKLIEDLREKSLGPATQEMAALAAFANSKGHSGELELWDVAFWSERMKEDKYDLEEEKLKPYFELDSVLGGMFDLADRLFGVSIEPSEKGEVEVWHDDVRFFKVFAQPNPGQGEEIQESANNQKQHLASFYLDPYSRPADKNGGAWMGTCLGKSKVLGTIPVAYLVCNGSPPVGDTPSLMTFRDVETLFHEFGHGLQHMLTSVPHGGAAGINNVEWDAVELPSQFMENWCYDRATLFSFAKHYQTGEPLPEEDYQKLLRLRYFQAGSMMLRQLYFARLDLELHSSSSSSGEPPFSVQKRIAKDYTVLAPLPEDKFLCSFSHIFAGGYAAGYYSYKWAEVMSADAFAAFEELSGTPTTAEAAAAAAAAGQTEPEVEEAVRSKGRAFRDTVLQLGGSVHPMEVFKQFRGREPSVDALLRHSGLSSL